MAHKIFISYQHSDKETAPRNMRPGVPWAEQVTNAIGQSRMLLLIFSAKTNHAHLVLREVHLVAEAGIAILPLRLEDTGFSPALRFSAFRELHNRNVLESQAVTDEKRRGWDSNPR